MLSSRVEPASPLVLQRKPGGICRLTSLTVFSPEVGWALLFIALTRYFEVGPFPGGEAYKRNRLLVLHTLELGLAQTAGVGTLP